MVLFGFFAYALRKMEYPLASFLLSLVLGPMMETSFRQTLGISQGRLSIFFERPISAVLMTMVGVTVAGSVLLTAKKRWMFQKTEGEQQT